MNEEKMKCPKCGVEHTTQKPAMAPGAHWNTCNIWYDHKDGGKCEAVCLRCGHEWTE